MMKRPVICHLSDFSPEYAGTFIDSLLFLATDCRRIMDIDLFCIFPERAKDRAWVRRFDEQQIPYAFVPRTRNVVSLVHKILEGYKPIIFHSHFFLFDISAFLLKAFIYKKAKIVWHYHNPTGLTFQQRLKDLVKLRCVARYSGVCCICVGSDVYRSLKESGMPSHKLALVHNGINPGKFFPNIEVRKRIRAAMGALENQTVFLLLGWDPIRKGVDLFIKAAAEVIREDEQNCLFIIIGRQETAEFASKFPESSRIGQSLRVIGPVEDFSSLLNGVDVLVSSSRTEGFSYAVHEAMAAGKLVLCSDIPGLRETCGKAQGVKFYDIEDWKMLAKLMKIVQQMPSSEKDSLGTANSRYVEEYYSLEIWAKKVREVYSTLLKER
jgi:glycosyltransferase involved in cell wall biosynthesis